MTLRNFLEALCQKYFQHVFGSPSVLHSILLTSFSCYVVVVFHKTIWTFLPQSRIFIENSNFVNVNENFTCKVFGILRKLKTISTMQWKLSLVLMILWLESILAWGILIGYVLIVERSINNLHSLKPENVIQFSLNVVFSESKASNCYCYCYWTFVSFIESVAILSTLLNLFERINEMPSFLLVQTSIDLHIFLYVSIIESWEWKVEVDSTWNSTSA